MKFQCQYYNSEGKRCENKALYRLYFSAEHPFDFQDTCALHTTEYTNVASILDLHLNEIRDRI